MNSNDSLVNKLVDRGLIESDRVEKAFRNVDRADFIPEKHQGNAYTDTPLPIAGEATISAPSMVAINTELLDVREGDRVFEIGSGSGYQLAILAQLTDGEVIGVEIIEELVEKSMEQLSDRKNVRILKGSGFEPAEGKFDRIIYSCAVESLEEARKHLKEDGIAVAPVYRDGSQILKKLERGEITEHGLVRFVPFVDNRDGFSS